MRKKPTRQAHELQAEPLRVSHPGLADLLTDEERATRERGAQGVSGHDETQKQPVTASRSGFVMRVGEGFTVESGLPATSVSVPVLPTLGECVAILVSVTWASRKLTPSLQAGSAR
jgi:hypothetical protein